MDKKAYLNLPSSGATDVFVPINNKVKKNSN